MAAPAATGTRWPPSLPHTPHAGGPRPPSLAQRPPAPPPGPVVSGACPAPPRPAPPFGPRTRSRGGGAASARPPSLGSRRRACPVSAAARAGGAGQAGFEGPEPGAADAADSRSRVAGRAAPRPVPGPASGEPSAADLPGERALLCWGPQIVGSFCLV